MRLIDADAFDKVLKDAQTECKKNGGNFRFGVLNNVRANLAKAPTIGGWISVKDRLPENADRPGAFCPRYLVMTKYGMTEGWYNPDNGCWYTLVWFLIGRYTEDDIDMEGGDIPKISSKIEVIYWMPLPETPRSVKWDG